MQKWKQHTHPSTAEETNCGLSKWEWVNHNYTSQGWIPETLNWIKEVKHKRSQTNFSIPSTNRQLKKKAQLPKRWLQIGMSFFCGVMKYSKYCDHGSTTLKYTKNHCVLLYG
jgi:hypothetical protein